MITKRRRTSSSAKELPEWRSNVKESNEKSYLVTTVENTPKISPERVSMVSRYAKHESSPSANESEDFILQPEAVVVSPTVQMTPPAQN